MINAMEVLVKYLQDAGIPANGQVAVKHRFPDPWLVNTEAVVLQPDGGTPELYLPVHNQRVEARCYAGSAYDALALLDSINNLALGTGREVVSTTQGSAVLYSFSQESGPSLLFDDVLNMDFALAFYEIRVSHQAV